MRDRGEVVQCVNEVPSERITRCGNFGTIGFGRTGGRRFQTCVRPYGEVETVRIWCSTGYIKVSCTLCASEVGDVDIMTMEILRNVKLGHGLASSVLSHNVTINLIGPVTRPCPHS